MIIQRTISLYLYMYLSYQRKMSNAGMNFSIYVFNMQAIHLRINAANVFFHLLIQVHVLFIPQIGPTLMRVMVTSYWSNRKIPNDTNSRIFNERNSTLYFHC